MNPRFLKGTAVLCRMLALFPFAVLTEAAGVGKYIWWHYPVFFAVMILFYAVGFLAGKIIAVAHFSKAVRPFAVFSSRAAVLLPAAVFIILTHSLELSSMLYLYVLPAALIAYYSGYRAYGREYGDLFSMGWLGLFFVSAVVSCIILNFSNIPEIYSAAVKQMCVVFGLITVLASLLANQTNIDQRTRQRSAGKSVLPNGLRGYNAMLIGGISAAIVALFLTAKPLAALIVKGIAALLGVILALIRDYGSEMEYSPDIENNGAVGEFTESADNSFFTILWLLFMVLALIMIIRFRRQILGFLKELFAPLFRESRLEAPQPFADEITDTMSKFDFARSQRRTEQRLLRQFKKESDPRKKFRFGYGLFMLRLSRSAFPPLPADTTSVHSQKGISAFRREEIADIVSVYNEVRYGDKIPSPEHLEAQRRLIEELR